MHEFLVLIVVTIVATLGVVWIVRKREPFADIVGLGDRVPEIQSLPFDLNSKYPRAYYSEMNNDMFKDALQKTFAHPETCQALDVAMKAEDWAPLRRDVEPIGFQQIYESVVVKNIRDVVKASPYFKEVEGDVTIAYERRKATFVHKQKQNTYLVKLEVVFHRPGKFQAKHADIDVVMQLVSNQWQHRVVAANIVGIVFEDQIAMHPVTASDPFQIAAMPFSENPFEIVADPILLDTPMVMTMVQRQNQGHLNQANSDRALAPAS